jgi:hypothetical protein
MSTVVLLATAWGPKAGGINTFNMDLARGLRAALGDAGRVICVVPSADAAASRSARDSGVTLASVAATSLSSAPSGRRSHQSPAARASSRMRMHCPGFERGAGFPMHERALIVLQHELRQGVRTDRVSGARPLAFVELARQIEVLSSELVASSEARPTDPAKDTVPA